MATTYTCDQCGTTSPTGSGWFLISVQLLHDDPAVPSPPGGRMLDSTMPDFHFETDECRTLWLQERKLG